MIERDPLFVSLTRPQMFAGVTYTFFVINAIVAAELFLIFKSVYVVLVAFVIHLLGAVVCAYEPRYFDLMILRARTTPRVRNHRLWQCNSYHP